MATPQPEQNRPVVTRLWGIVIDLKRLGVPTWPIEKWISDVASCGHDSMDGIDQTDLRDPAKRWRCMECGVIGTHEEIG